MRKVTSPVAEDGTDVRSIVLRVAAAMHAAGTCGGTLDEVQRGLLAENALALSWGRELGVRVPWRVEGRQDPALYDLRIAGLRIDVKCASPEVALPSIVSSKRVENVVYVLCQPDTSPVVPWSVPEGDAGFYVMGWCLGSELETAPDHVLKGGWWRPWDQLHRDAGQLVEFLRKRLTSA